MSDFDNTDDFNDFDFPESDDNVGFDDGFDDTADADDDILDNFEDEDSPASLDPDEINRRLDAYEAKTIAYRKRIVKAKQFDKKQRLEAVEWLGESGEVQAIPQLIKVYQKDKTPGMKEAAAYALGQFKSLGQELDDPETERTALERIQNMVINDEYGKKASATSLIMVQVGLVISAIVLFGLGAMFNQQAATQRQADVDATETARPTATQDSEDAFLADIQGYYDALLADSLIFQQDIGEATRGDGTLPCNTADLANPSVYDISPARQDNANFVAVVDQLNSLNEALDEVRNPITEACQNSGGIMDRQEALDLGGILSGVQGDLVDAIDPLNAIGVDVTEQVFATAEPSATATPDESIPTPTEDLTDLNDSIIELERLIGDLTDLQGASNQINFYWQQINDSGELYVSGCNQPPPIVPDDYVLEEGLVGQYSDLDNAVSNVNIGLQSTRLAVDAFYEACDAEELPENIPTRLTQTQLALDALAAASGNLSDLQSR